jgi:hypothetical protein
MRRKASAGLAQAGALAISLLNAEVLMLAAAAPM